jgi:hypothetical protein
MKATLLIPLDYLYDCFNAVLDQLITYQINVAGEIVVRKTQSTIIISRTPKQLLDASKLLKLAVFEPSYNVNASLIKT